MSPEVLRVILGLALGALVGAVVALVAAPSLLVAIMLGGAMTGGAVAVGLALFRSEN